MPRIVLKYCTVIKYLVAELDGCYFGSTFCNLFFMTYHDLVPELLLATGAAAGPTGGETLKYTPRVFGFKIHASSRSLPSGMS
jgi:hypothetical protein